MSRPPIHCRLSTRALTLAFAALLASCGGTGEGDTAGTASTAGDAADGTSGRRFALAVTPQQAALAKWTAPIGLSLVPASGAVLANGKVLFWASDTRTNFGGGGHTYTSLFDPATNTATESNVTNTGHDMFCPGTARLPDGRLLVNGGVNAGNTSLYDPATNSWSTGPAMNIARGYNASVTLADGSVMTLGGSWSGGTAGGKTAEIYTPATGWRVMSGIPADPYLLDGVYNGWQTDAHMSLVPTANGKVLMAGPSVNMAWIDTRGNGSSTPAGRRGDDTPSLGGNVVMYDAGKILKVGGSTWNNGTPSNANAYVIDTTAGTANVRKLPAMAYARMYHNSVVLPNGQVLIVGGQTYTQEFSDNYAVLAPELFDPSTETFTVLPAMSVARNYHSIALLLPDARVVSAGGGLCNCAADHADLQIMSPPYLFNADGSAATRPVIASAPATVGYGTTATVTTNAPVTAFSLVRIGATTHTVNNGQRRVALTFTAGANNSYQLAIPGNPGILIPGQWMLFAMNAQGTPSVAKIITVSNSGAPVLQNPGDVNTVVGRSVNLPVVASTPSGTLAFSATNLPAGLAINTATGAISGTPTGAGNSVVTIAASNGAQTVSTDIVINVGTLGTGTGLRAEYYANATLAGTPVLTRAEAPNFDWGTAAPATGVPADNFSARWSGFIEATASGATQIRTVSDDGVRVWVDNRLVIDNWTDHGATTDTATVNFVAGQRYAITVEYYEAAGGAVLQLQWLPPGATTVVPVPQDRLYPASNLPSSNLALGKAATQSSTFAGGYVASRAVDGSTDGVLGNNSVTHTDTTAQPWWQVDLGGARRIDRVQLWNRTDCCSDRLNNFVVLVSSTDMTGRTLDQLRADPAVQSRSVGVSRVIPNIGIPVGAVGRYVRVQLTGQNPLSLAEVQVYGGAAAYNTPSIAAIANQQSVTGAAANLATSASDPDGNPLTYSASGLPPGLAINAGTGVISGTVGAAGTYNASVSVRNDGGFSASAAFTWTVLGPVPQVTSLPAPIGPSGSSVSYNPVLSPGASATYSWNFGDGSGDTPYAASAATSHSYAAAGTYTVTLTLRTGDGRTATYRFVQAIQAAGALALSRASSQLALETRANAATRLWVVNQDNDSVSVFDTTTNARVAEVTVGTAPRSVAIAADGRAWVVNKEAATISIVSPTTLAVVQTIALPRASQPHGLVFSPADGSAFVTLEGLGRLLKLHGSTGAVLSTLATGDNPRHLALTASGDRLLVSRFITRPLRGEGTATVQTTDAAGARIGGEVLVVDPATLALTRTVVLAHSERPDAENQGRGIPNYLGAVAVAPDGRSAWVPSKQDNVLRGTLRDGRNLDFQNTVRAISSRIDLAGGIANAAEDLAGRVDHDNASLASAAAFHPSGVYLFVALETSRQVAVVDAAGRRELFRYEVGLAPQAVAVSADGLKLYVGNFMGRSVSVVDLQPLVRFGQAGAAPTTTLATIATEKLAATVLQGKKLFYDARDPRLARDAYMSCASCHNDGGHDGRTWDFTGFGEGLRNTIALRGRAAVGQGFMHWSANFDELQDFEGQIRNFAGGTGLMSDAAFNTGTRSTPLGDRKAGQSADLDALAAYVASLTSFASSPWRNADGTLTTAGTAGKAVFQAKGCGSCHAGTAYTASADAAQLKNIGTIKPSSGKRLNGTLTGIDIPTLRDAWATAPYLHDGSAATLADAVQAHGGITLTAAELANVTDYLRQIGSEEPAAPVPYTVGAVVGSATGGTAFTDPVVAGQKLTGVTVRAGWWIDSIQGLATPANLPAHGGTGGGVYTVTWPATEWLVRVYGRYGVGGSVAQISFVTNTGRVLGPYGTAQGQATLANFDITVPAGNRVLGFTGRSGTSLNAIGLIYGP